MRCMFIYDFFFFQAEDGIRDRNVTGVQTCALPICPAGELRPLGLQRADLRLAVIGDAIEHAGADTHVLVVAVVVALCPGDTSSMHADLGLNLLQAWLVGSREQVMEGGEGQPGPAHLYDEGVVVGPRPRAVASAWVALAVGLHRLAAHPAEVKAGPEVLTVRAGSIRDPGGVVETVLHGLPRPRVHDGLPLAEYGFTAVASDDLRAPGPTTIAVGEHLLRCVGAVTGVPRIAEDPQDGRR